ncbi:hypothetical protein IR083_14345 [Dysgonomonas sp. GY75]|uniref:hypothetical protein n=1 Tax=Dysgonomonas sp. GY75 TaxID=2780419 RepID=UPI001884255B|nr:hypothetical protein [Dysgonomonas sp. GY75]MBF0650007.1 hypothetical protein [Dysgonomonas sp. GY75]
MHKFRLLILLVSLTCFWSCDDVTEYDLSFGISGVVIPEYEDGIQGTEVTIEGRGFQSGDRLHLRPLLKPLDNSFDIDVEIKEVTSSHLKFLFPLNAQESGYSLVLIRGDKEISLGSMQQWLPKGWVADVNLRNSLKVIGPQLFDAQDSLKLSVAADFEFEGGTLNVSGKGITNLSGLENFPKLKTLWATDNNLGNIELIGMNGIVSIFAWSSNITSMNIQSKTLQTLYMGNNPLTELDLSKCPALLSIVLDNIKFRKLDISNCMCFGSFDNFKFDFDTSQECQLLVSNIWFWHMDMFNRSTSVRTAGLSGVKVTTVGLDREVVFDKINWGNTGTAAMPDANLRTIMKGYCPQAFSGNDIIISEARNAKLPTNLANKLDISNKNIASLDGLKYFDDVWHLVCDNNNISEIDMAGWFNLTTISAKNAGLTSFVTKDQPWLRDIDLSNNTALTHIDMRGISLLSNYDIRFIATGCPIEYLDIRNGYAWSTWAQSGDKLAFDFTTNTSKSRILKVETADNGGWSSTWNSGVNPVQKAIEAGVRVEYYNWTNAATGNYGELLKTVN